MVGGVYDLEQAVTTAETVLNAGVNGMDWSNTLMIVTSDHSNSYLRLQEELGKGNLPVQTVVAGKQTYADGEVTYSTTGHTNELVTLQARGAGAELFKEYAGVLYPGTNIVDNTRIYEVMMSAAKDQGVERIVLFIGDGMNIEHEIGRNIELMFSEEIRKGTGTIEIHSGSPGGTVVESYDAATSSNLTISGSTLIINPTAELKYQTQYYVTFDENSIYDTAANHYAGNTAYNFTTRADPYAGDHGGTSTETVIAGVGTLGLLAWLLI
ncbi:MAG: Ig-like domain-containing protein [Chlorobium sp.]|jgi:hypothetical protein|nr:Ig-like domain-containing protein [Chlorobium sp.]